MKSSYFHVKSEQKPHYNKEFETSLKKHLSSKHPYFHKKTLEQLAKYVTHPQQILNTPLITESHPLKQEALIISEAFETVTNGMHQREVLEALETLNHQSFFQPWKHLILAILSFYHHSEQACQDHLNHIPSSSPLHVYKGLFNVLLHPEEDVHFLEKNHSVLHLAKALFQRESHIDVILQQLEDSLDAQMEEVFFQTLEEVSCLIKTEEALPSLILWAWNQMSWQNFNEKPLFDLSSRLLGHTEAYRLAALGTLGHDPERALLLWGNFVLQFCYEVPLVDSEQAWLLLFEFVLAVADFQQEQGIIDGWEKEWKYFAESWNKELIHWRPDWQLPSDWATVKYLAHQKVSSPSIQDQEIIQGQNLSPVRLSKNHSLYGQLELF